VTTASPFGVDISTFRGGVPGLDPTFSPITGGRVVVEAVLRRWLTPRGSLDDIPEDGCDVRKFLQMRMTAVSRARAKRELEVEAQKEDGVASCTVLVEATGTGTSVGLRFTGTIKTRTGSTFRTVISATALATTVDEISDLTPTG
jgi:hypothetical protein